MSEICLWEILVPTMKNNKKPIRTACHKNWDSQIRKIVNGLTILQPVKGQWKSNGVLFAERMIPVRIACTKEQIEKIANLTIRYYDQIAIMYYKISNDVFFLEKDNL